jgi:hypothetical protein
LDSVYTCISGEELLQKLQEAEAAERAAADAVADRATRLEEALFVADSFQQQYGDVLQALNGVQENLMSQDAPAADPGTLQEQLKELLVSPSTVSIMSC